MFVKIPLGIENFAKIREGGFYYVDKTALIQELLNRQFEANLITRPRRFGKTLTMSMLEDFFDISRDSRAHFEGLAISGERALCEEWQNQWPVVSLSLKSAEGLNFQDAYGMLKMLIANTCKKYAFLAESTKTDPADRKQFDELRFRQTNKDAVKESLALLTRMMSAHYGKQTILLIDEYDVPLAKAHDRGYYAEMLDVIRAMLGAALKTNPCLKFGVITGCLKISKESIFTGINNLVVNTITADRFDESVGFTEPEVRKLFADVGFPDRAEEARKWYDGYRFGSVDVYCPWDVLHYAADLMENPSVEPGAYWADTSSNDVIYKLFENEDFNVNDKFEALMDGECIQEIITEDLTYDSLEASEKSLWSLLFMTGYLTQARVTDRENIPFLEAARKSPLAEKRVLLRIPNEEIKLVFKQAIVSWFRKNVQTIDRTNIFRALWNGDAGTAAKEISDLLFDSISYHDYRESYYHAFLAGLFAGAGYMVESNYEYGNGRPDVVVKERRNRRAMLFEIKHAGKEETIESACRKAVGQIREKRYAEALDGYRTVLVYGVAFKGKDCWIKQVE